MISNWFEKIDRRELLSTLWIFAILNYLYADVLTFFEPGILEQLLTGSIEGIHFTESFLFIMGAMMETAIVMVLLSRILKYRLNRWANIVAGAIHTLAVFASMFVGSAPSMHYIFYGTIEIITTLMIIWLAWTWREPTAEAALQP